MRKQPPPPKAAPPYPVRRRLAELRALRDELRGRAHLAGVDARAAWELIEPRFAALEVRAAAPSAPAGEDPAALGHEIDTVGKALVSFRERLNYPGQTWSRREP